MDDVEVSLSSLKFADDMHHVMLSLPSVQSWSIFGRSKQQFDTLGRYVYSLDGL